MKWMFLSMCLFGCSTKDDSENDETIAPGAEAGAEVIDVNGSYNSLIAAATGCGEESFWLENWSQGPMMISGENDALTFDFMDGMEFGGAVTSERTYSFSGQVEFTTEVWDDTGMESRMAVIDVQNSGTFIRDGNCWEMDGDFTLLVDEDGDGLEFNDCTLTGPVKAKQIQGGTCNGLN
jgi:hypothetical protein